MKMKKKAVIITLLIGLSQYLWAQKIELVNRDWITQMSQNKSDTTYVINFWATWCKPCVEEIPHFEKLYATYKNQKVKVIMVSCDFKKQLETIVVFMNEPNPNNWIDKVDEKFTGAIPATLIINGSSNFRYFSEGETTYERLEQVIKPLIN
jgi:thiol-disulfide isomerase/thioredoxin